MSARDRVLGVIAGELHASLTSMSDETTFDDVSADSLDMVLVVMALEEAFDVEITDDEWMATKTLGDVVKLVDGKVGVSA